MREMPDKRDDMRSEGMDERRPERMDERRPEGMENPQPAGDRPGDRDRQPMSEAPVPARTVPAGPGATARPMPMHNGGSQMDLWPDMSSFHHRFGELESEFIEDPKAAVTKAEKLVEEAIDQMAKMMHDKMHTMHKDTDGKDSDTETLRQTMRSYRHWIESVGAHRAA